MGISSISNTTAREYASNSYNYMINYEKPQSNMKDLKSQMILTEKNDRDNDVYRNAVTKATEIAEINRYCQGTFDLSLLVAGRNESSYFKGKLSSSCDVDYFHVDTSSQILSKRPVIVNMEMPEEADYNLTVYDSEGNQVGMAVSNEDGTKTLSIPCDWSSSRGFVIKISQNGTSENVEGNYKLTFSQGELPQETKEWMERMKTAELVASTPEKRAALAKEVREKINLKNESGIEALHQTQYDSLPQELKYDGTLSINQLLEKEVKGEALSEAEKVFISIYGNQNEVYLAESLKKKQSVEQDFSVYLDAMGLSNRQFDVHLATNKKAEVTGLSEEENQLISEYIETHWDDFKKIYLSTSKEAAEMSNQEYRIAGYVEECNRLLSNVSHGQVSVEDLYIQRKQLGTFMFTEEIAGLPMNISKLINNADSTSAYFDYKEMLYDILGYQKQHGEIPQYNIDFSWNGKMVSFR